MTGRRAHNAIDYTGLVINNLIAMHYVEHRRHKPYWMFRCKCGVEKVIDANRVKSGIIKSCGCWRDQFKPANFVHRLYHIYKRGALDRGYKFSLSKKSFNSLISGNCYYCGSAPDYSTYSYLIVNYSRPVNGIDRLDSGKNYFLRNCVSCCKTCNLMKMVMPADKFTEHCTKIALFQREKK